MSFNLFSNDVIASLQVHTSINWHLESVPYIYAMISYTLWFMIVENDYLNTDEIRGVYVACTWLFHDLLWPMGPHFAVVWLAILTRYLGLQWSRSNNDLQLELIAKTSPLTSSQGSWNTSMAAKTSAEMLKNAVVSQAKAKHSATVSYLIVRPAPAPLDLPQAFSPPLALKINPREPLMWSCRPAPCYYSTASPVMSSMPVKNNLYYVATTHRYFTWA